VKSDLSQWYANGKPPLISSLLTHLQSALFNFQSLLLVFILLICTSAYTHQLFPGIMDRNKNGYEILSWSFEFRLI
jgi:hypothetical protein